MRRHEVPDGYVDDEDDAQETAVARIPEAAVQGLLPTEAFGPHTLERAKERLGILVGLKKLAIRSTVPSDWVKHAGRKGGPPKPYLCETGAQKFAQLYGVSFRDLKCEKFQYTDDRGPVIEFYVEVSGIFQARFDTDGASASSKDEFFNGVEYADDGSRTVKRLPLSEIKVAHVRAKAISQAKARVVRKLLGLSFTWDEVAVELRAAGHSPDDVPGVSYSDGSRGGGQRGRSDVPATAAPAATAPAAPQKSPNGNGGEGDHIKEIATKIFAMAGRDPERAEALMEELSTFTAKDGKVVKGVRSAKQLTVKWANSLIRKVREEYERWLAEGSDEQIKEAGAALDAVEKPETGGEE